MTTPNAENWSGLASLLSTASRPDDTKQASFEAAWMSVALQTGLAGLILERLAGAPLPAGVEEPLRRAALAVAASNLQKRSELESVLRVFNEDRVDAMLLKGAALNLTLYPRPDLRPMSDVDLLVRTRDLPIAEAALLASGCRRGAALIRRDFFPRFYYESEWLGPAPVNLRIDLHVRPFRPLRLSRTLPDDGFWQDARPVDLGSTKAWVPSPEIMLMHLAAHAAYHGCSRLLWLYDIHRFLVAEGDRLDWLAFVRVTRSWGLSLPVRRALEQTDHLFGAVVPPQVRHELSRQPATWADRLVLWHAPRDAASPLGQVAVNLLTTPGLCFRAGYLLAHLLPDRSHLAGRYPYRHLGWPVLAQAARLLRQVRLLAGAARQTARLLLGGRAAQDPA